MILLNRLILVSFLNKNPFISFFRLKGGFLIIQVIQYIGRILGHPLFIPHH